MKPKKIVNGNPTNASFNSDGTFTDDYTRLFEDVYITPKGIRTKNLYRYQQPWDDVGFMKAVTYPLRILNPLQLGANVLNSYIGKKTPLEKFKTLLFGVNPEKVILDNAPLDKKIQYAKSYFKNKFIDLPAFIYDLSNENVVRVTDDTKNVYSILTNDFIENKTHPVRHAKDFINTEDTIIGDKHKIPLSKIRTYYGVEDGKLKAGPLSSFNEETIVVPNRAKYVGKIKGYYPGTPSSQEYIDSVNNAIKEYNILHGYTPTIIDKIFGEHPKRTLLKHLGIDSALKIRNAISEKYKYLDTSIPPYVVTENNDTIPIDNRLFNMTPKILFANENGDALFVRRGKNSKNAFAEMNKWLQNHPSYPIMVDNGRYSHSLIGLADYGIYKGFDDGDRMYAIGTTY